MLEKTDLRVMDNIDTDSEVEIENSIIINEIANSTGIDKAIIENISIQVSLANILLNNEREENVNNFVSFVPLKWNNKKNEQLEQIKKVFKSIHKIYCNKEVIAYEVYEPRERAIQIFNKMLDQNKINKKKKYR